MMALLTLFELLRYYVFSPPSEYASIGKCARALTTVGVSRSHGLTGPLPWGPDGRGVSCTPAPSLSSLATRPLPSSGARCWVV